MAGTPSQNLEVSIEQIPVYSIRNCLKNASLSLARFVRYFKLLHSTIAAYVASGAGIQAPERRRAPQITLRLLLIALRAVALLCPSVYFVFRIFKGPDVFRV
jgi:hypothetical protein